MKIIEARNVNDALAKGLEHLRDYGVREDSRNGPVLVAPGPVVTVYSHPWERVLFSPLRDANPFLHFFESLWMLAGCNDIAFLTQFAKNFTNYSDDGLTQRGAYGYRWRKWFGYDQLNIIVEELKRDPNTRRAVLAMWDSGACAYPMEDGGGYNVGCEGKGDLLATSKDKPCNTHVYFDVRGGKLNMTVLCRSNDIWWGAYGANAVHFSYLLEYMASKVGVPQGEYRQFSNNYHIYTDVVPEDLFDDHIRHARGYNRYTYKDGPTGLDLKVDEAFEYELQNFLRDPAGWRPEANEFLRNVAYPMYQLWKTRDISHAGDIWDGYWRFAAMDWVARRKNKKEKV